MAGTTERARGVFFDFARVCVAAALGTAVTGQAALATCTPQWTATSGTDQPLYVLMPTSGGGMIGGGQFTSIEGTSANWVAQWNGGSWASLGGGLFTDAGGVFVGNPSVRSALELSNGHILVGGSHFASTTGGQTSVLAQWDGSSWSNSPSGLQTFLFNGFFTVGNVLGLAYMPSNNNIIAVGVFAIQGQSGAWLAARWDGSNWLPMIPQVSGLGATANAVLVRPDNGHVYIAGTFTSADSGVLGGNNIVEWDGSVDGSGSPIFSPLNFGTDSTLGAGAIYAMAISGGDLLIGGGFTHVGNASENDTPAWRMARWGNADHQWHPTWANSNSGFVYALANMPNGDLVAGGSFTAIENIGDNSTTAANLIARQDHTTGLWSPMDAGLSSGGTDGIDTLAVDASGTLWIGGDFTVANGVASPYIARYTCTTTGACCTGLGCTATTLAACTGSYLGDNTVCNAPGSPSVCCPADFDGNGTVNVGDIFAFLRAWFAHDTSADIDGNSTVNVSDIFAFLRHWFSHC